MKLSYFLFLFAFSFLIGFSVLATTTELCPNGYSDFTNGSIYYSAGTGGVVDHVEQKINLPDNKLNSVSFFYNYAPVSTLNVCLSTQVHDLDCTVGQHFTAQFPDTPNDGTITVTLNQAINPNTDYYLSFAGDTSNDGTAIYRCEATTSFDNYTPSSLWVTDNGHNLDLTLESSTENTTTCDPNQEFGVPCVVNAVKTSTGTTLLSAISTWWPLVLTIIIGLGIIIYVKRFSKTVV